MLLLMDCLGWCECMGCICITHVHQFGEFPDIPTCDNRGSEKFKGTFLCLAALFWEYLSIVQLLSSVCRVNLNTLGIW